GTTSVPFIGYDTSLPQELGLYRVLVTMLLQRTAEEKLLLNYSSGAGDFKRRRGGEPVIEFNAIYTRHLPARRRAMFAALRELSNRVGRRFLEKNEI
ncbi:MAG TPA: GNAT family N-acetyltransferase, partial [Verrucomicrobiae bacterium]|nr:GNAT family N-acetyltransferase [Verrucomicrobiae bacterium]